MSNLVNTLTIIAGIVTSLSIIFGFFIKYFYEPWERRKAQAVEERQKERLEQEKRYHDKMIEVSKEQNQPILEFIEKMQEFMLHSNYDRKNLNSIAERNSKTLEEHDAILDNHTERLIVLESQRDGITQTVAYKEEYGKENE